MNPKDRAGAKKPNLSVLPFAPLLDVIPALYEGRRKYGPWNWRAEEVSETIYADAAIRHLMQFIAGEDIDPDSGVHHISKAIAGLLVVRDAQLHGCSVDDRFVNQNLNIEGQMEQLAGVNERYPDPVESALPEREIYGYPVIVDEDQGITGGETMTPEDAEKVAEHIFRNRNVPTTVENFILDEIEVGDRVAFANGDRGYVNELDLGDSLCLWVIVDGHGHWYDSTGAVNAHDRQVEDGHKQIASIVTDSGIQTVLRFELKNPICGMAIRADGRLESWSSTPAGGGSYELKLEDVGKNVQLRNGLECVVALKSDSLWPYVIRDTNGEEQVTVTQWGQASPSTIVCGRYCPEANNPYDVVKVVH